MGKEHLIQTTDRYPNEVAGERRGYALTPKEIPVDGYIIATEEAGKVLSAPQRAALRAEVTEVILRAKLPRVT